MELKRIIARDSRSANEKAIQLYGSDVLIISSQRVDQQTELIVAVEVSSEAAQDDTMAQQAHSALNSRKVSDDLALQSDQNEPLPFARVFQNASAQAASVSEPEAPATRNFQTGHTGLQGRAAATERPTPSALALQESAQALAVQTAQHEHQRSQEIVAMLREEMSALRREFALSIQMQPWQQMLGLSPDIQRLSIAMQEVGMPVALRSLLTDSIQCLQTLGEAWPVLKSMLAVAISRAEMKVPDAGVHILCGPSGAGKTSMLGRLAHAAAQIHGADKQVMISYGDQRPGVWSQIQLLASQAGASCLRAADLAMLQALLDDLQGRTIWIDTPGTDFVGHAQQLKQSFSGVDIHAVLPVDATVTSVQKILQSSNTRWSSLMLTKVDEAAYPWPLIKGLCDQSLSVSCMGEDSRIHVPPLAFRAERLVDLAMMPLQALLPEIQPIAVTAKSSAKALHG
jgi:flagellar biosynthesis GTPase FlhF